MCEFVTDRADDRAGNTAHNVRAIPELADFLNDRALLLFGNAWLKDDYHSACSWARSPLPDTKKPQAATCGGFGGLGGLIQPETPVRRFGKVIPTGRDGGKVLAANVHWQTVPKAREESRSLD